jgi:serine/threonine protein kinase
MQETFTNETKIIKSLKNPHILAIESLYISKKELVCVIEYLEGGTLLEELKNVLLPSRRTSSAPTGRSARRSPTSRRASSTCGRSGSCTATSSWRTSWCASTATAARTT